MRFISNLDLTTNGRLLLWQMNFMDILSCQLLAFFFFWGGATSVFRVLVISFSLDKRPRKNHVDPLILGMVLFTVDPLIVGMVLFTVDPLIIRKIFSLKTTVDPLIDWHVFFANFPVDPLITQMVFFAIFTVDALIIRTLFFFEKYRWCVDPLSRWSVDNCEGFFGKILLIRWSLEWLFYLNLTSTVRFWRLPRIVPPPPKSRGGGGVVKCPSHPL